MEEQILQGVIFEPSQAVKIRKFPTIRITPPKIAVPARFWVGVIFLGVIGYLGYYQLQHTRQLKAELSNVEDQLLQTQREYETTLQEKITLQSVVSRLDIKPTATSSSRFVSVRYVAGKPQKVAQSFKPTTSTSVVAIQVFGNFAVGNKIKLSLYEFDGKDVEKGKIVSTASIQAADVKKGSPINFLFDKPVSIDAKQHYIFVVESEELGTELDVEVASNLDGSGMMYEFAPRTGKNNEILDLNPMWTARDSKDLKYNALIARS